MKQIIIPRDVEEMILRLPLGLLINFNEVLIKDGIRRILNLHLP